MKRNIIVMLIPCNIDCMEPEGYRVYIPSMPGVNGYGKDEDDAILQAQLSARKYLHIMKKTYNAEWATMEIDLLQFEKGTIKRLVNIDELGEFHQSTKV